MTTSYVVEGTARKPLRLWPGVLIVVLQSLAFWVVPRFLPNGPVGMYAFLAGAALGTLAALVWWAFFSRAPHLERWGALVLMVLAIVGTQRLLHPSVAGTGRGMLFYFYVLPVLCLAFVLGVAASRRFSAGPRRAVMAASILLACGVFTLVRSEGVNGDGEPQLAWRWAPSPEERLLAQAVPEPAVSSAAPAATPAPAETAASPSAAAATVPDGAAEAAPAGGEPAVAEPTPAPAAPAGAAEAISATSEPVAAEPATLPAAAVAAASDAEWPGFRGPQRDSVVRGVRIDPDWAASPPVELWRRPIGPGWSSFAVRGDRLYTQEQRGEEEVVSCYGAATGEPIWIHRDATRFWEANAGAGPRSTPTLHGERVYTLGATGTLNALDAADGRVVWSRNAATDAQVEVPFWGFAGSPLVVGDLVVVAVSGRLVAYGRDSGEPRWSGPETRGSYSSPHLVTLDGVPQILMMNGAGIASYGPADGTRLWEHALPGAVIVQPALTADGGLLISTNGSAGGDGVHRVSAAHGPGGWTAEKSWTSIGLKPYFNDLVVHEGHAYGFDGRILACIDLGGGERKWKGGRYGHGQMLLLPEQDLLLVLSEEGELVLVKASPDSFTELARRPAIQGKTWNHPVLVGDLLLVRNSEEMAAFRLALGGR